VALRRQRQMCIRDRSKGRMIFFIFYGLISNELI
jgi:hypothetical protein